VSGIVAELRKAWASEEPLWRRRHFWLALAALILPGGWIMLLFGLVPERDPRPRSDEITS
jgi:hypothetical protein